MTNILPEKLANDLSGAFDELSWVLEIKDYSQKGRLEVPIDQVKNRNNLVGILYEREHELDMDDLFYIRLVVAAEQLTSEPFVQVTDFLNSDGFIESCKSITGAQDITHAWVEATCYDKGCFLGNHRDDHHPGNRVAFVLNMTCEWKLDWGGLLLVENKPDNPPVILPPLWNSLSLIRIPVNHTVSGVTQAATEHRYSITGWLRP
ncbi:2OG-Fe(II) oxygenase [Gammaproteobacteria bacterium]|nr:2OG-Fe(II) oxygenase [Gammaproteobacteria bacterium]